MSPPKAAADNPAPDRRRPARAGRGGALVDLALLGVLAGGPVHGYEVKRQLDQLLPVGGGVSFGSLYPALGRLERSGEVRGIDGDAGDSMLTGALTGELAALRSRLRERGPGRRGRKVYAITSAGRARLVELLTSLDPADDRTFALQVAYCRHLDPTQRLSVLARRRAEVANRLEAAKDADDGSDDPWQHSLHQHAMRSLDAEVTWVDDLMAIEPPAEQAPVPASRRDPAADHDDLAPTLGLHTRTSTLTTDLPGGTAAGIPTGESR
jgi:DNA-binding PadR family transcriptional regulator